MGRPLRLSPASPAAGRFPRASEPDGALRAPGWARDWVGKAREVEESAGEFRLSVSSGPTASLACVRLAGAGRLGADRFERQTSLAYHHLRRAIERAGRRPARFWNFLPAIGQAMGDGRDRYMVFNSGRRTALADWLGTGALPAASAVGHRADDLTVYCLALDEAGIAVDNPRQIPAYRYSPRYGPASPSFARATAARDPRDGAPMLLAAGTASIIGERSIHESDASAQLEETLCNLDALLASGQRAVGAADDGDGEPGHRLRRFVEVRVYCAPAADRSAIEARVARAFGPATRVDCVPAALCRTELLVEIEGIARLGADPEKP